MTGQNDTVFTFLAEGNNFVTEYSNKLEEIYSYDETEITDFLVPQTVNGDTDLEVLQREKLVTLRKSLCQTLCVAFPQYGVYELYDRRKLILLAKDILYLGNSIRNVNIDKRLKKTFKNYDDLGNGSQSDETIHPDTPVIGAEDVAVSCIALRDSVLTLNNLVTDLKKEISDLKSYVVKLEVQINKDPQTQTPTEPPTDDRTVTETEGVNSGGANINNNIVQERDETGPGTNNSRATPGVSNNEGNYQLPREQRRKVLCGSAASSSEPNTIVRGTSDETHDFRAAANVTTRLSSIYIGNTLPSTTTDNIRNHLQTIGLGGEVSDIQELRSRDFTKKSFCVTFDNVTAENKSYEVKWPRDVVVRPYRTYQKQAKRGKSPVNKGQGQSNKHSAPRGQTYSTDTSNKWQ